MVDYQAIRDELDAGHPATGAYDVDDVAATTELNLVNRTLNRTTMTGKEVKDAINSAEWNSRSADQQNIVLTMCNRDDLDPFGIDANILTEAFSGAGGVTTSALNTARVEDVSRAVELGLGTLVIGDIQNARALP